jgi:hypothetical protein
MLLDHFEKHLSEAEGRIGGKSLGIGEMTDRIESTVDIGRAID